MSDTKSVSFSIVNNTGHTMATLWANHNTSDTSIQAYMLTNVANGDSPTLGSLEIVSRTDDYFTVMWTDSSNNLYGTPYQYETETSMNGGNVILELQAGTFQFTQVDEGSLGKPANYLQYIVAPA